MKKNRISALALAAVMSFGYAALPSEISPTAVVEAATVLSAPTEVKYSSTTNSITLKWNSVSGADAYRVYMYNNSTKKYEKYKDIKSTTCTVNDLETGEKYNFKIAAMKKGSNGYTVGDTSSSFSAMPLFCIPNFTEDISQLMSSYGYNVDYGYNSVTYSTKFDGNLANADEYAFSDDAERALETYNNALKRSGYTYTELSNKTTGSKNNQTIKITYKVYYNGEYVGNYIFTTNLKIRNMANLYEYGQMTITHTFAWKDGIIFGDSIGTVYIGEPINYYEVFTTPPQKNKATDLIYRFTNNRKYYYILIPKNYSLDRINQVVEEYSAT